MRSIISRIPSEIRRAEIRNDLIVNEPFILFTYTDGLGQVPKNVINFLESNHTYLRGVIASGNLNFGQYFCKSADLIREQYDVPIIMKIDLRGTQNNIKEIEKAYKAIMESDTEK